MANWGCEAASFSFFSGSWPEYLRERALQKLPNLLDFFDFSMRLLSVARFDVGDRDSCCRTLFNENLDGRRFFEWIEDIDFSLEFGFRIISWRRAKCFLFDKMSALNLFISSSFPISRIGFSFRKGVTWGAFGDTGISMYWEDCFFVLNKEFVDASESESFATIGVNTCNPKSIVFFFEEFKSTRVIWFAGMFS